MVSEVTVLLIAFLVTNFLDVSQQISRPFPIKDAIGLAPLQPFLAALASKNSRPDSLSDLGSENGEARRHVFWKHKIDMVPHVEVLMVVACAYTSSMRVFKGVAGTNPLAAIKLRSKSSKVTSS